MKNQFVSDIFEDGKAVNTMFAVKFKKPPRDYKGKPGKWFELRVSDRTGEIGLRYWGKDPEKTQQLYDSFGRGDVVFAGGVVQDFEGRFTISVDGEEGILRKCAPGEYGPEDFVATTERDRDAMLSEVRDILGTVQDADMKRLLSCFTEDREFMESFRDSPAAMEYHQNYRGGLLEHTLNVMKICRNLCAVHPELDRDLVLTGAFLHDIGKVREFETKPAVIDVSRQGMLEGHTVTGCNMLSGIIGKLENFPENLRLKLMHILISHHGREEYGSPKRPQFPEAVAVYYADDADAKVDLFLRLKREANTDDSWIWSKKIKGHVYLD